jgi:hypothetical protein
VRVGDVPGGYRAQRYIGLVREAIIETLDVEQLTDRMIERLRPGDHERRSVRNEVRRYVSAYVRAPRGFGEVAVPATAEDDADA